MFFFFELRDSYWAKRRLSAVSFFKSLRIYSLTNTIWDGGFLGNQVPIHYLSFKQKTISFWNGFFVCYETRTGRSKAERSFLLYVVANLFAYEYSMGRRFPLKSSTNPLRRFKALSIYWRVSFLQTIPYITLTF